MNILLIVESPTKEKSFSKYLQDLPDTYTVKASVGHIRELTTKGKGGFGVDLDDCFKPTYEVSKDKVKTIAELKKLAKKADKIILATDPDREGESIAWHLADTLELSVDKTDRIEFYEITKDKVLHALAAPRKINMDMVQSQEARRILDRIVGFKLSKILSKKVYSPAGGRVQSVALRFVIEREIEVLSFKPQVYFSLHQSIATPSMVSLDLATYLGESVKNKDDKTDPKGFRKIIGIDSEEKAKAFSLQYPPEVILADIAVTKKKQESKAPFRTSTLQQEASSHPTLKFSPKRTQRVAQSLFEGVAMDDEIVGLVTYIRTDSVRLADSFVEEAVQYIEAKYGKEYVSLVPKTNTAVLQSQDAHEAIRPTSLARTPEIMKPYLNVDQYRLYKLIYERTIASLMVARQYEVTSYTFEGHPFTFKTSGSVTTFPGFSIVHQGSDDEAQKELPKLEKGATYPLHFESIESHATAGPSRYSEAKLIQELEAQGIGRPSTYAATLERLKDHHYVSVQSNTIWPNPEAHAAIQYLLTYFKGFIDPTYTSLMETKLDLVKDGETTRCALLSDFYTDFSTQYDQAGDLPLQHEALHFYGKCPLDGCDGTIVPRRSKKFGLFLGCSNYPTCSFVTNDVPLPWVKENPNATDDDESDDQSEKKFVVKKVEKEFIGRDCPECGKPLLKRHTKRRNRPFIGCSGFPSCKFIENIKAE
jgi:DNA topoisomerase I